MHHKIYKISHAKYSYHLVLIYPITTQFLVPEQAKNHMNVHFLIVFLIINPLPDKQHFYHDAF